jgi:hypothetical protein
MSGELPTNTKDLLDHMRKQLEKQGKIQPQKQGKKSKTKKRSEQQDK